MGRGKREVGDLGALDLMADLMDDTDALLANCLQAEAITGCEGGLGE